MGLFDFIKKRAAPIEPLVGDALLTALMSGQALDRKQVLTIPAVSGNVDFLSGIVATMPIGLYRRVEDRVDPLPDDPRVGLLNGDTGDTLDAFQMKKAMVEDYLLGEGGYCFIERRLNSVTGLFYVEDRAVSVNTNGKAIHKAFEIYVDAKRYEPYEFLKLLRNTKDGASGTGLTEEVSKVLETAYSTLIYQVGLMKNGGNKRGFLTSSHRITPEEMTAIRDGWDRLYSNDSSRVIVLNEGVKFNEAANTAVEMQLDETKRTLTDEIDKVFHIHPDDFDLTFKTAIYPIVRAFETALNRDLLLESEKPDLFFKIDTGEITRAALKDRYEAYRVAKETGFLTLNEIRKMEQLERIEGLDVINVGLSAVLYDTNTQTYYTPNTDTTSGEKEEGKPVPDNDPKPGEESED